MRSGEDLLNAGCGLYPNDSMTRAYDRNNSKLPEGTIINQEAYDRARKEENAKRDC